MKIKTAWALQSLALCLLFNLAFAAVIFYMARSVIDAANQWVLALGASGAPVLPANALAAVAGLKALVARTGGYLMGVLFVLGASFTLLLWFFAFLTGARQIERQNSETAGQKTEIRPVEGELAAENG